jgi:hypothetical protein
MQRFIVRGCCALALSALLLTGGFSAPSPKSPPAGNKIEEIRKALDSVVTLEESQTNLPAFLEKIGNDHKIQIVLDRTVLAALGLAEETMMVETKQKDVKLRTGLRNILGTYGLTFAIIGDQVVVTTEEMALYKQFKQRIDVDFNEVPVSKAMKDLSQRYGVNIVLDPKCVKAKTTEIAITLQLEDVAFEGAVRLMSEMAGLKPARLSNVIYITTEDRADKINKDSELIPNPHPDLPGGTLPGGPGFPGGIVPAPGVLPPAVPMAVPAPKA